MADKKTESLNNLRSPVNRNNVNLSFLYIFVDRMLFKSRLFTRPPKVEYFSHVDANAFFTQLSPTVMLSLLRLLFALQQQEPVYNNTNWCDNIRRG